MSYYPHGQHKIVEIFENDEKISSVEYHLNGTIKSSLNIKTIKKVTSEETVYVEYNDNGRIIYSYVEVDSFNKYNSLINIEKIWIDVSIFGIIIKHSSDENSDVHIYKLKDTLHAIDLIKHVVKSELLRKTLIDFETGGEKF